MKIPAKILFESLVQRTRDERKVVMEKGRGLNGFNKLLGYRIEAINAEGNIPNTAPSQQKNRSLDMVLTLQTEVNNALISLLTESDHEDTSYDFSLDRVMLNRKDFSRESQPSKIQHVLSRPSKYKRKAIFGPIIDNASKRFGVNADLINAVIKTESDFDPNCTSSKGAMGLMQLMPETAKDLGVKDAYNPFENIMAGTRYLKSLLDRYNGRIPVALAAYNWGMGNVERNPGRLPHEVKVYISRVSEYFEKAKL